MRKSDEQVRCPSCGGGCTELSYKVPLPPKRKERAWAELWQQVREEQRLQNGWDAEVLAWRKHGLEHEIAALQAKLDDGKNPPHPQYARELRRELKKLEACLAWYGYTGCKAQRPSEKRFFQTAFVGQWFGHSVFWLPFSARAGVCLYISGLLRAG